MALSRCFSFLLLAMAFCSPAESGGFIGVNYGRIANNLPNPSKVVELLKSNGISEVKLYDAEPTVLAALSKAGIRVTVALPNELLSAAASHPSFAYSWVKSNVAAWLPSTQIRAVAVGNEVFASSSAKTLTPALLPAMRNIHSALQRLRLDDVVKVSSPVALTVLQSSYPPSTGAFRSDLTETVKGILDFLKSTGSFLMVNAYPFFAYAANADVISIDYALFRPNAGVVDAATGLRYFNLLDAQLDAVYSATKKIGYGDVNVVISETGWPSKGDANEKGATPENAAAYNGNLARRILTGNAGTPLRPDSELGVFLFALFNENQKPGPTSERNYGLFYPNEVKVYDVDFELNGVGTRHDQRGSGDQGTASAGTVSPGSTWCVADGRSGNERLQLALDFACGEGGANCGSIQPGKECFYPNTLLAHASFAFNSYYQKMNRVPNACYFGGAALIVAQPPRFGECVLPAGN